MFTTEEYKKMHKHWVDGLNDGSIDFEDAVDGKFVAVDYEADNGMYVTCSAQFEHETSSSSPIDRPYDETCDYVICAVVDLKNIKVYDGLGRDAKVVEGAFDYDAFFEANE